MYVVVLITQRSRVQIPPPLPGSAGQRPDRREAIGPLGRLSAIRPQDRAMEPGSRRGGSAGIGHMDGRPPGRGLKFPMLTGTGPRVVAVLAAVLGQVGIHRPSLR